MGDEEMDAKTHQFGNDPTDARAARERELALLEDLGAALLVGVLHRDDDLGLARVAHEVHRAAEALDLARQHPVGQVALAADLHRAEDRQVDAPRADHAKRLVGTEARCARQERDRLLARVDEVRVFLPLLRVGAQAEDAVLGLQLDFDGRVDEARCEHRHPDSQVGVHAVLKLLRRAPHNALTLAGCVALAERRHVGTLLFRKRILLDVLLCRALNHALHIDARQVHGCGVDIAYFDNMLRLDNGHLRIPSHRPVEVRRREAKLAVTQLVGLPRLHKRIVSLDTLFHNVALATEHLDVPRLRIARHCPVLVVLQRQVPRLHHRPKRSRRVESGDARSASPTPFGQGALRRELHLDLAAQIHALEGLVLADVAGDHLLDLLAREQQAQPGAVDARVVGDGGEAGDGGRGVDLVDEGVRDATEAEATGEEGRVGLHVFEGFGGGGEDFVDFMAAEGGGEVAGEDGLVLQLVVSGTRHRIGWLISRAVHAMNSIEFLEGSRGAGRQIDLLWQGSR